MPYIRHVTLVYLAGMVGCAVLMGGLNLMGEFFLGKGIPKGLSAVSVLVPALLAGMSFVNRAGRRPEAREAWALSLWFTLIQIVTAAILLWAIDVYADAAVTTAVATVLLLVLFVILLIGSRLGLGLGVYTALRQQERARHS
ncbi:ABZJ_00895 family protein [Defluviimonas sp. SAOS-178_SWC]|uniref:ABZJ_00895 family protein n=1 Tax=Defluviimonas sp. SAOS-178_SWC TaxID=3121287 RepID=UPI0032216338